MVVDAGSTGSRIYMYRISKNPSNPVYSDKSWSKHINPGLSTIKENEVEEYLSNLMVDFTTMRLEYSKIDFYFYATAGMRLLDKKMQDKVLVYVKRYFTRFGFACMEVKIIDGVQEGIYSWITVNYLKGLLNSDDRRLGILELGGASAQIAYEAPKSILPLHENDMVKVSIPVFNRDYYVYSATFLGYGTKEAYNRYLRLMKLSKADPCLPHGRFRYSGSDLVSGKGDFDACLKILVNLLNKTAPCYDDPCYMNGIHAPFKDLKEIDFVGISEFFYVSDLIEDLENSIDLIEKTQRSKTMAPEYQDYVKFGKMICKTSWEKLKSIYSKRDPTVLAEACFKVSWITSMLYEGLGLDKRGNSENGVDDFAVSNSIKDHELTWTLGVALSKFTPQSAHEETVMFYIVLGLTWVLLLGFVWMFLCKRRCR
jgi:Golgi nucleoside diphosphatase